MVCGRFYVYAYNWFRGLKGWLKQGWTMDTMNSKKFMDIKKTEWNVISTGDSRLFVRIVPANG